MAAAIAAIYAPAILLLLAVNTAEAKKDRKIVVNWNRIESCPNFDNAFLDLSKIEFYQSDESNNRLRGTLEIKKIVNTGPLTINVKVERQVAIASYMPLLQLDTPDICDDLLNETQPWGPYLLSLRPAFPEKCPIRKGAYDVSSMKIFIAGINLKRELVGSYKVLFEMNAPSDTVPGVVERVSCYHVFVNVEDNYG